MKEINPKVYQKHHSFQDFQSRKDGAIDYQKERAIRVLREYLDGKILFQHKIQEKLNFREIVSNVFQDLTDPVVQDQNSPRFKITLFIAEEMYTYSDEELIRFFLESFIYILNSFFFNYDNPLFFNLFFKFVLPKSRYFLKTTG